MLLRDPVRRAELGRRARLRIDERFSIQRNVEATQRIYARVMRDDQPRPVGALRNTLRGSDG
jgi:hypothetical protein